MYIPKGKLDPKVYYTDGGEYYYSTTRTEYVGYYHKDLSGGVWTEKEHTKNSIKLLSGTTQQEIPNNINIYNSNSSKYYNISEKQNKPTPTTANIPTENGMPPTQEDYQKGFFTRYILEYKQSTKPKYIEVNKTTYFQIQESENSKYYNSVEVLWKISGPLYDKKQNNILVKGGIIDSNKRSIQQAEQTIKGISNYLNDLTLYARPLDM